MATPLFAFFGFWATTLGVAAAAVSVPIIIHLLNRRRFKIVVWAAMRFLLAAQKQNTRKMRLEQLILLLVRCSLVLLLVLAMAAVMPWAKTLWAAFWPEGAGAASKRGGRTHHIYVLDGSLSMNLASDGKTLFDRARQMALDHVNQAPQGDGFSVLVMKDSPVWIVGEASPDARKVAREIEILRPSHGNAALPATLNMVAAKLMEASGRFPVQNVYFFTDLQRATWLGLPPPEARKEEADAKEKPPHLEINNRGRTAFIDLGREEASNTAITDLALDVPFVTTGAIVPVSATVQHFGAKDRKNVRIEILLGRAREAANDQPFGLRVVGQELISLLPGERQTVNFGLKFPAAGTYALQVKIDGDELEYDDARTVIVTVKDTIPVLIINGKPAADPFERASEYLRLVLNPFPKGQEPKWAPLRPQVISAAQFVDMQEADLADFDCIFLSDVPQLGGGELRRLESHLRRGGGLIVSLGDRAADNIEVYNRLLYKNERGLLPAQLFKKVAAPEDHHFTLQAQEEAFLQAPLKAFSDADDQIGLRSGRFRQYVQAKVGQDPRARVIMTYMPELDPLTETKFDKSLAIDDPALIEWNPPLPRVLDRTPGARTLAPLRYRGKVILFTSTVNMDWNTWPGSPSFGAMMQECTRLAASGKLREQAHVVGQFLEDYLLAGGNEVEIEVHFPEGSRQKPQKMRTRLVDDLNIFRWTETDYSGIYRAALASAPKELLFAVNTPATTPDQRGSESDLSRVDKTKLQETFPGWDFQIVGDPRMAQFAGGPVNDDVEVERGAVGPYIAHWLLVLALVLLFAEVILAWKFGHYSSVEGQAPAAVGAGFPLVIAVIAGGIFVVGAWVLFDAARTGDFLSFLPDGLRGGVETALGVPAPPPGENTRWELERQPWLPDIDSTMWITGFLALGAALMVFFTYRAEAPNVHPAYKFILGGLRLLLILITLVALLPQLQLRFDRQGWPDIVVLIDDSRSMGEPDHFQDEKVREASKKLSEPIRKKLQDSLPAKITELQTQLTAKTKQADNSPETTAEIERLTARLQFWQNQLTQVNSPTWRPTRLQLALAVLASPQRDWLHSLVNERRSKVHIYHLDASGRAIKLSDAQGAAGEITELDPTLITRAHKAIANLEAEAMDSRLGTALRQVIDHYRGSALTGVIMFTDGVTTRDETIALVADYAAQKGVPLFFVGIGDDHEIRDLRLHDLQVDDTVFVNDYINFEARLTGQGYKDLTVPVVLKVKEKDGKEKELHRIPVRIDPSGKSVKLRLRYQPTEAGRKHFVVEVELPKSERPDKTPNPASLRLERTIDVIEAKLIKVLYVEGTPRYEFRFIKYLLEREDPDDKKNKSVDLRIVQLDADPEFAKTDKTALPFFPATRAELDQYDVVIIGDCDPKHEQLGPQRLKMLADFVRGEDAKGNKTGRTGGGLLMVGGPMFAPHAFKDTPLAEVLPIEPLTNKVPADFDRPKSYRMELTPIGRMHSIFKFTNDDAENFALWQKLAPIYWSSSGFRLKPLAEVLAVHPTERAPVRDPGSDGKLPLVVQHFVGSGRCMFFGIDETWRWRFRDDEPRFKNFWIQVVRYLSRTRVTKTDLRLDKQTPYRLGEPIKVTVRFPENAPGGPDVRAKLDVKVTVEYRPTAKKGDTPGDPEIQTLTLAKLEGSQATFEALVNRTREGKYRFRLTAPDVSKIQPDGEKPSAEATVELPPGELERLRMNQQELMQAADSTQGRFYTIANANDLLDELPAGFRVSLSTPRPPVLLWNHWLMFLVVLGLFTAEWVLRKRKHLL
ncbi:MAG: VWA domain-containing protein [Gemmataceae bacterium]|nr:VWA domain-containing protein [Gemmataceae bacterium]